MKHSPKVQFNSVRDTAQPPPKMMDVIEEAKLTVSSMTGLKVDSIAQCTRGEDQNWTVAVDVIESVARMGNNDLLATYEVLISPASEVINFQRLRRYHREDKDA